MKLIDADALYERIKELEELARDRVIDTPNSFSNGSLNPAAVRYMAQLSERTRLKDMIYDAPTIEPEPKWIPCSERLPEEKSDWKTVTVLDESGDTPFTYTSVGYYLSDGWWIVDNEPMEEGNLIRVIAWMPLPKPYKGEQT